MPLNRWTASTSRSIEHSAADRPDAHLGAQIPRRFLWAADAATMVVAFLAAYAIAPDLQRVLQPGSLLHFDWLTRAFSLPEFLDVRGSRAFYETLTALGVLVPLTIFGVEIMGGYQPVHEQSRTRLVLASTVAPLVALSGFTLAIFTLKIDRWSRAFLFTYTLLSIVGMIAYRTALRVYKRRRFAIGRYARAVAFVGIPEEIDEVVAALQGKLGQDYRLVGYFDASPGKGDWVPGWLPNLGSVSRFGATLIHTPIDLVIVVESDRGAPWLGEVLKACDFFRIPIHIIPDSVLRLSPTLQDLRPATVDHPMGLPGVFLRPWEIDPDSLFLKRLFDLAIASTLLMLLSPIFLVIAAAIKLTTPKESVFYRWKVIGYKGRPFTSYKFTTMVADADDRKADLMHLNEMSGPVFKIKDDPRITRLGRFLRKYSLNELPQLWSVVKGDMSLVGPRPPLVHEVAKFESWHRKKLCVRPGITCLWQVNGRNAISEFDDWVKLDIEYIDNWSLWLDFKILLRTIRAVFGGSGS